MNSLDIDLLIETLFDHQHFKLLLHQEISVKQITTQHKPQPFMKEMQTVTQDITQTISSIIQFKIQHAINQEYSTLSSLSSHHLKQIQQLKQQIKRLKQDRRAPEGREKGLRQLLKDQMCIQTSSTISDRTKSTLNSESLQLTKIKQQLDTLKTTVSKLSNNSILQFVSEANLEIHQKMQENFTKINNNMHQISSKYSQDLDKSTNSIHQSPQETIDKISELQQRLIRYKQQLQSKMQAGLRSVWNVITNMENTIHSTKKLNPTSLQMFQSPSQKTLKKGGSFASLLGWK